MTRGEAERTRDRILRRLCEQDRTAAELADALDITRSAVREQLVRLEAEGLVEHRALREGVGKPAHLYRLSVEGRRRVSGALIPLLEALLAVLADRFSGAELEALLRETGHVLAGGARAGGAARERAEAAREVLERLGGAVELEVGHEGAVLEGRCCPAGAVTTERPEVCVAVETLLADVTGLAVGERCDRGGSPRCRFHIRFPAAGD